MKHITIITLSYNNISDFRITFNSIRNLLDLIEWIIVDGSTNDDIELFLHESKCNYIYLKDLKPGIYNAINYGISNASGRYINILNSGDEGSEDCIKHILKIKEEYDIISSKVKILNKNGREISIWSPKDFSSKAKIYNMPCAHQGLFIALNLYRKYGLYNLNYKLSADYEFIKRIITNNIKYKELNIIGGSFYLGGASSSTLSAKETFIINIKYSDGKIINILFSIFEIFKMAIRLILLKTYS